MLQLRKVQILGFKSFCDRTEVSLEGHGIAAIVGPNGCGKSNISDAITWVLGEQSAKSLRGLKMEDVIFAGTRERRPTGMAEVSLTLVDPAVFEPEPAGSEPTGTASLAGDWDEAALRAQSAQETEDATVEAQPGQTYETEMVPAAPATQPREDSQGDPRIAAATEPAATGVEPQNGEAAAEDTREVVLKVRRRKFGRMPIRTGEIVVTRRLFRSGESEYLLNGKICRLRDIQDIFLGTGLGGDSYAIIGQERIGQLLSARPLDRRSIIEEAAGITRFKAKKRLAELRLESARTNLARVDDIFDEVTRQMAVLKRQAAKAERYGELRTEFVGKLRLVLASRLTQMDAESAGLATKIERLGTAIEAGAAEISTLDAEHTAGTARGYELERELREITARANAAGVDLERAETRIAANTDRGTELTQRLQTAANEVAEAREALAALTAEREQHRRFLETATAETNTHRTEAQAQGARAAEAMRSVQAAEAQAEASRRNALSAMQRANTTRTEIVQAEAALAGFDRENDRLHAEAEATTAELNTLQLQREQAKSAAEAIYARLKDLETEIAELRKRIEGRRAEEAQSRRAGDGLRAELATQNGRRSSLEALIREHSYSTDTVRNLFRANARRSQPNNSKGTLDPNPELSPVGTLADFLEVDGRYENLVDEFLREELNYIIVKSWEAADDNVRLLHGEVAGRATFLVRSDEISPPAQREEPPANPSRPDLVALRDCVKINGNLGPTLLSLLPRLRDGFIAPDSGTARSLALEHPQAYFLSPTGETFRGLTVSGGKPSTQGPLALKRELAAVQAKVDSLKASLAQGEEATAALGREIGESTAALDARNHERRDTEREAANASASLRSMENEAGRLQRRAADAGIALKRNADGRTGREEHLARKRAEADRLDAERTGLEQSVADLAGRLNALRTEREQLQATAGAANTALAGLEERRRNADANAERTERLYVAQGQRLAGIESAIATATAERLRRAEETATLKAEVAERTATRTEALATAATLTAEAHTLRTRLATLDTRLRTLRAHTDSLREQRGAHTARQARLSSDLEHLEATCVNDLSLEPQALRDDASIPRLEAEALTAEDEAARNLRRKMEAMGPVNMMALDELREITERHTFLTTQRADLLSSIENTAASIREIDDVSRIKFDEAFRLINENFSSTFTKLFGGGQAFMRLTEIEGKEGSDRDRDLVGIDIIASPPGKKLQNILLLSGGEKALTALALLVGTFQFQPAPFCVLDEVDAPLDETNMGRFARLISEMSDTTQFVVITHSKRTMEQADIMYGVTMQEPGVSKIVSVSLSGRSRGKEARSAA